MWSTMGQALGWTVATVGVIGVTAMATLVVGMRTKSPRVLGAIRRLNRSFTNPRVLRRAGRPGESYGVVEHRGRTSGRPYRTPVGPFPVEDGFVISLPYGPGADWVQNVLAAGDAVLVHDGIRHTISAPAVVGSADVRALLPATEATTHRLFGVTDCLRVRTAEATDPVR